MAARPLPSDESREGFRGLRRCWCAGCAVRPAALPDKSPGECLGGGIETGRLRAGLRELVDEAGLFIQLAAGDHEGVGKALPEDGAPLWRSLKRLIVDLNPTRTDQQGRITRADGRMLDEVYHGGWFNEYRRIEGIKAHTALGGRLVHGCQSVPDQSGGVVAPYGTSMADFAVELAGMKSEWIEQVESHRVTTA